MRAFAALVLALATASIAAPAPAQNIETVAAPSWRTLSRFRNDGEFHQYLSDVRDAARRARGASLNKQDAPEEACPPEFYPCEATPNLGDSEDNIVVTGSRIPSPSYAAASPVTQVSSANIAGETSITNVQNLGVDEGDIVKLWGRYLIILQDGRLFSVDIGGERMRFVDRADVYRSSNAGVWYDEILVQDRRVVVTGYNYSEDATEFSIFSINDSGRFTREAVYFLSSNDYYDIENYASRLVNGNLVIYTPLAVNEMQAGASASFPLVRRWLSEGERSATTSGRPLYNARDIYRPIQATYTPVVHTISVCPLGSERGGDELDCNSTAIVGPPSREFYVSTSHIYLWTWPGYNDETPDQTCPGAAREEFGAATESALFQIPLFGGQLRAQFVRGAPYDQLSMDANAEELRALSVWINPACERDRDNDLVLRYMEAPLSQFSATPRPLAEASYTRIPSVGRAIENRFTGDHLIYGGRDSWYSYAPDPATEQNNTSQIVVVPTARPAAFSSFEAPHNILRVERVGDNAVLTGYRNAVGLSISFVRLDNAPRIASTLLLPERYESEGRSHAFNSVVNAQGEGMLGLPTIMQRAQSGRWWWRSSGSDVSFVSFDANGQLSDVGAMRGSNISHPDYDCEVSCVDWYGNSRALFIRGRVFALAATELIEGRLENGHVRERQRLNLTDPPPGGNRRITSNRPKD
jgi:hypothetical protein